MSPLARLQHTLKEKNMHGIFVTNPVNIYYLTGLRTLVPAERESTLLVTPDTAFLYVPRMYEYSARKLASVHAQAVTVQVVERGTELLSTFLTQLSDTATLAYEGDNVLINEFRSLESKFHGTLCDAEAMIEHQRVFKTPEEIAFIREAVRITDETYNGVITYLRSTDYTALTELDIVDVIRKISRDLGGEGFSFDPIVASGAGSAEPHYCTSNTKLKRGDLLLIDLGVKYHGYCGDLTRCVVLGKATEEMNRIYALVLEANRQGIAACIPGTPEKDVFAAANDVFKKHQLEQYFLHSLGHGIGLSAHEISPYIRSAGTDSIEPHMAVTIEPGLYFAEQFGIRIEDYLITTEHGYEILSTKSPKETLLEI